jgi:hypothetical protein
LKGRKSVFQGVRGKVKLSMNLERRVDIVLEIGIAHEVPRESDHAWNSNDEQILMGNNGLQQSKGIEALVHTEVLFPWN